MRLTAFKAHGFKSFADPVSFKIGGELIGIVGPNGCGKSNIVDAIRWTLGESRALSLRGATLSDVLFNGSQRRTPADLCRVELIFDNSTGDAGGVWNTYPQIVVKREFSRDGRQRYLINENNVRRRDVVDLFRGTGIAPRAYGVVEQGMVSNIADSSAEELRAFMEEAAGVSHYKERRRESDRRLAASQENLQQIALMLADINKRIEVLKRQARTARRYRELGEKINQLDALLMVNRRQGVSQNLQQEQEVIAALQENVKQQRQRLEDSRQNIEANQQHHQATQQVVDTLQANASKAQATLAAAERDLQNMAETRQATQTRLGEDENELATLTAQATELMVQDKQLQEQINHLQQSMAASTQLVEEQATELSRRQTIQQAQQKKVDTIKERLTTIDKQVESETVRQQMINERILSLLARINEAEASVAAITIEEVLASDSLEEQQQVALLIDQQQQQQAEKKQRVLTQQEADAVVRTLENDVAVLTTEISTLTAMFKEEDNQTDDNLLRLAHALQVDAGHWARALDAALGLYATALVVDDLDDFLSQGQLPPVGKAAVELKAVPVPALAQRVTDQSVALPTLLSVLNLPTDTAGILANWLGSIYVADSAAIAAAVRHQLGNGEHIVTVEGSVYAAHSVLVYGETRGGYDWEQRRRQLGEAKAKKQQQLEAANASASQAAAAVAKTEDAIKQNTTTLEAAQQHLAEQRIAWHRQEERRRALLDQQTALKRSIEQMRDEQQSVSAEEAALTDKITQLEHQRGNIQTQCNEEKQQLDDANQSVRDYQHVVQSTSAKKRDWEVQHLEIQLRQSDTSKRLTEINERQATLKQRLLSHQHELSRGDETTLRRVLTDSQQQHETAATALSNGRQQLDDISKRSAVLESERESHHHELEHLQQQISDKRITERELTLNIAHLNDSIEELALSPEALTAIQDEHRDESINDWQQAIETMRGKRERLGAINYMADDELREQEERSNNIEAQKNDIENAIAELQAAIYRIDNETKTRLQDMFDGVNREFIKLFQQLFGGGEARLEMIGDSILEAGFELKVRPPGKRMFSVRMLSGGEKATAAVAFIFSILRLNPPPFCILDEVDAPLDDTRSYRFVDLLKDIAKTVQCLVVTHNKSTIEQMPRLIGVTQEELGISKIVSVTLDDALQAAK